METRPIQFAAQTYLARSGNATSERLVNCYLEQNPQSAKGPVTLYGSPGLDLWTTVGSGPNRGMLRLSGGDLFVVSGQELYVVDQNATATLVGTVLGNGFCRLTENGAHVAIATNDKLYAATATTIIELTQSHMNGASYQDGYGLFSQLSTQNFWITGLDDMTTIGGLDFSTADAFADFMIGLISVRQDLWLFKQRSTEIWRNTGASGFPFARAGGGFIERGCHSPGSIAKTEDRVFWLGDDLRVYASSGYNPQAISTPPIDDLVRSATGATAAESFIYDIGGHKCYQLGFSDLTLVYDLNTGLWHERKTYGLNRWRAHGYALFAGEQVVGDYANGNLYLLDLDTYTDGSDTIVRSTVSPPIHAGGEARASMPFLYADFEMGVGLASGQGSSPTVMLDWSDDGGNTFVGQRTASLGEIGDRAGRAQFSSLGSFRSRSLRLSVSDPVKFALVGARAAVQGFH